MSSSRPGGGARQRAAKRSALLDEEHIPPPPAPFSKGGAVQRAVRRQTQQGQAASSSSGAYIGDADGSSLGASMDSDTFNTFEDFRHHACRMYLRNKLSAEETAGLVRAGQRSGARGVADLSSVGCGGFHPQNTSRDLMSKLLKEAKMPEPYYAEVPVRNPKSPKSQAAAWLPFLLPHEMMAFALKSLSICEVTSFADEGWQSKHAAWARSHGCDVRQTVPMGFHGDGVPHKAKMRGSVEVMSWNFATQPQWDRFLFGCIDKMYLCDCGCKGRHTIDAMLNIFTWSLRCLLLGKWPTHRHDKMPWKPSDKSRSGSVGGTELGFHACLLQVRGDWAWMKQIFGFKGWSSHAICWKCLANKGDIPYTDFSLEAKWRSTRHHPASIVDRLHKEAVTISPLFQAPGFCPSMICVDILHCLDLGVSADALGNLMFEALNSPEMYTGAKAVRIDAMWKHLQAYYRDNKVPSKLDKLTWEMVQQPKKSPKLRAKGAECRYLVPWGVDLALKLHERINSTRTMTILQAFTALFDFYMACSTEPFQPDACSRATRKFLILYSGISSTTSDELLWRVKPKFHLFSEMGEYQSAELGNPRHFWAYADESFVGFVSTLAASRGGGHTASTLPERTIARYRIMNAM